MGKREYSAHSLHRVTRLANYFFICIMRSHAYARPVLSRFLGNANGPLNFTGLFTGLLATAFLCGRTGFRGERDLRHFNAQDKPKFWFKRYDMLFPPSFLNNRRSAHYIEINNIFFCEMMKKYIVARREILAERDRCT